MSKRLLYISVHSVLEYDELTLFTELGYDCFSLGAYTNPEGHWELPRPGIRGMKIRPDLIEMTRDMPRTELTWEFLNNFDIVVVMDGYAAPEILERNWELLREKKVILRTIGQSLPGREKRFAKLKKSGLKIVRYSPAEERIPDYAGEHALIRFYKDPEEFTAWNGNIKQVINFTQTLKGRRDFCGYDALMEVGAGFPFKVYGNGNEDLGEFNGGTLPYENMKGAMRDCRVFLYGGTWPASYTLSFIEAMMTGMPIVAVGKETWKHRDHPTIKLYEIPQIISNGDDGFYSDNTVELKGYIQRLLDDREYALKIGSKARTKAINLFGKETIKQQWATFLGGL